MRAGLHSVLPARARGYVFLDFVFIEIGSPAVRNGARVFGVVMEATVKRGSANAFTAAHFTKRD